MRESVRAGPSHWADTWSECGGESQSPINIELAKAKYKDIGALDLHTYDKAEGYYFDLTNNGHTGILHHFRSHSAAQDTRAHHLQHLSSIMSISLSDHILQTA